MEKGQRVKKIKYNSHNVGSMLWWLSGKTMNEYFKKI